MTTGTLGKVHLRPFHETILEAINRCDSPSTGEILRLMKLLRETKIPKGHDEIIDALNKYWDFPGASKWGRHIRETKQAVLNQKPSSVRKTEGIEVEEQLTHDNLQVYVDKIYSFLHNREEGCSSWHIALNEELQQLHGLLSKVFK